MTRRSLIFILLAVLAVVLAWLDLSCGSIWIDPLQLGQSFFLGASDPLLGQIIWQLRLPKMLTAILAGAALAISGLMMQTLFRNPLAGPYILGVSSGASLGVALITMGGTLFGFSLGGVFGHWAVTAAAVVGSTSVLLLVLVIARRLPDNISLLITGMMVGAIAGALVNILQNFSNPDSLKLFITWTFGSLSSVGWEEMRVMCPMIVLGLAGAVTLLKPLDALRMGDNYAEGLGIDVPNTRLAIVLTTGLLAGATTVFCGPIAFIGVAVPHLARGLFRTSSHRVTLPASALIGVNLLLVCDILCGLGTYPLPISTTSALFGAPIILYIILKKS